MRLRTLRMNAITPRVLLVIALSAVGISFVLATSNREYGPNEYAVIDGGLSPDRKYSIAAHGGGELGYDNFHIYLMNAVTGKKIGPLEEIKDTLDTGAEAFYAKWSPNSNEVAIRYRIDRRGSEWRLLWNLETISRRRRRRRCRVCP